MRREKLTADVDAVSGLLRTVDPALAESELNIQMLKLKSFVMTKKTINIKFLYFIFYYIYVAYFEHL